jgi:hypothetical protein
MILNPSAAETQTGLQKAAMLLVSLGEECSAEILKHLSEDEVDAITRAITRLPNINSQQAESVLNEFHQMTVAQDFVMKGGMDYARKMLSKAFGPEVAKRLGDRLVKAVGTDGAAIDVLQRAGRVAAGFPAPEVTVGCRRADGNPRPDLTRNRSQDRNCTWSKDAGARSTESRVIRRHPSRC